MAGNRSFKDYVADRFYNELFAAIKDYVEENGEDLDLRLYQVRNVGSIELSDIEVKFVSVNDLPEMKIEFEVALEAEMEVREADYHYDDSEYNKQWFMIKCTGDLDCSLDDFSILSISVYNGKNKQIRPLSDSLVPIIHSKDLEEIATDFLRRNYPKALLEPMAVEPQKLAECMGLDVQIRNITKDCSVFGQIFFHDVETELYDEKTDHMIQTEINARTIYVDPNTYFLYNLGKVNNTIVHECVHWDKHRKAFELERLYNSSANRIKCKAVGGLADNSKDATEWMEWQANALAPRIQMPITMFKTQASRVIKQIRQETGKFDLLDIIEPVIDSLAMFFAVSRLAAKIRMVDAGYEEAIGAFTYMDGHYVAPHRFKKDALKRNQTFSVDAETAAIQSLTNNVFGKLVRDGSYQYVDSHFVLNLPKYLTVDEYGHTILTDYARHHMEECCLVFDMTIKSGGKKDYHSVCYLNKDKDSTVCFDIKYGNGYAYGDTEKKKKLLENMR